MKGKLIKVENGYNLFIEQPQGRLLEATCSISEIKRLKENDVSFKKLSHKNCQAIERGYDLDDLADTYAIQMNLEGHNITKEQDQYFKDGFMYALQILGDKKFSEEALFDSIMLGVAYEDCGIDGINNYTELKELAISRNTQTEWDVEIEMEPYHDGNFTNDGDTHIVEPKWRPKLDTNGCLILKRK